MNGFGFLVPRVERRHLAACTWVGSKFAHRVPPDKVLLRCFVTGDVSQTTSELREKMGITAEPLFERVWDWPESMPQYSVGHAANVAYAMAMLKDFPGLFLTGNAYYGVGIPDCVRMAAKTAEAVLATTSAAA
jgi:oxygen-dependent protoporphyrinogen oxidase